MTRINVIPPNQLCDEHLLCELHEILRIPQFIIDQSNKGKSVSDIKLAAPDAVYKLGTGHVRFFYDKLKFLQKRYEALYQESINRGFNRTYDWPDVIFPPELYHDYEPTKEAILLNMDRIVFKFVTKFRPNWTSNERNTYV